MLNEFSRKLEAHETPALAVLSLLASNGRLLFFLLLSTSPLLQGWLSLAYPAASPYRLYSLSNLASLLALASSPVVVEPQLPLKTQAAPWVIALFFVHEGLPLRSLRARSELLGTGSRT